MSDSYINSVNKKQKTW